MSRQVLRIYEDDDETVALEFSTDPSDPLPYLKDSLIADDQQIDLRDCSATIGAVTCELVDVPTVAGDQDSGAVTGELANANGESVWIGHRAEFLREESASLVPVFDGIVGGISLLDTLVTYHVTLEDITARGRKVRLFTHHETVSMIPPGPVAGFGNVGLYSVIPPADVAFGTYTSITASSGRVRLEWPLGNLSADIVEAGTREALISDTGEFVRYIFGKVAVRWRANSGDAWKTFRNMPVGDGWDHVIRPTNANNARADIMVRLAQDPDDGSPPALPTDGQDIQVQVLYSGPPTEAFPMYIEGPAGEVLKDILDGAYSEEDPRIRYDETRMTELADEVEGLFATIEEPADDLRDWLQEHWFGAFGYLPTIRDGVLYPVRLEMPDATPTLVLDDSNVASARWSHERADAVTVVEYTYIRHDQYTPLVVGPGIIPGLSGVGSKSEREVTAVFRSVQAATVGEAVVRINPITVREIIAKNALSEIFDVNVLAAPIVQRRGRHLIDRLRYGAQRVTVKASRHDSEVADAHVGTWGLLGASWLPEYDTLGRGANRLVQIVAARNVDDRWREFVLLDAGPDVSPLAQPTLGALSLNADGTINAPVTALPEGEAAVYYAVSPTQPPASSGLWLLAGRIDATGTVLIPAAPSGAVVQVRLRAEAEGAIYSSSVYDDITVPVVPRIRDVRIELAGGTATIYWTPNADALGVLIEFSIESDMEAPAFDQSVEVDASLGVYVIPVTVPAGFSVVARLTPYTGWTGSAVSGSAGPAEEAFATRGAEVQDASAYSLENFRDIRRLTTEVEFGWEWGFAVEDAAFWITEQPADVTTDPWPDSADPPDIIVDAADPPSLTVPVPPNGSLTYVEARARWGGGSELGPRWRGVITPAAGIVLEYIDVHVDGTVVTVYTDEAGLSIKLERTDVAGWVQHFDVGPDRKIVFDVGVESASGEGDQIGAGETWPMLATVYGEPVNEVGVGTPEISQSLTVSEASATPAEWVRTSATAPTVLGDEEIDLSMHATDVPDTVEVWGSVKEPGLDWAPLGSGTVVGAYARLDDTADFSPDPNVAPNIPDAAEIHYAFQSGYTLRAKAGGGDTTTAFQFRFDLKNALGVVVATETKAVHYYANVAP